MKKFLLIACAIVLSLEVNAQKPALKDFKTMLVKPNNHVFTPTKMDGLDETLLQKKQDFKFNRTIAKAPSKVTADEAEPIALIEDNIADIHECSKATIAYYDPVTEVINPETGEIFTFNCELVFGSGYVDVHGNYNKETSTITIPAGFFCGDVPTYGPIVLFGLKLSVDGSKIEDAGDVYFYVDDESGAMYLENDAYATVITSGEYANYIYFSNQGTSLLPVNATLYGVEASGENKWEEYMTNVAVEDFGESINIYNFLDMSVLNLTVNDDLTVTAEPGQPMLSLDYVSGAEAIDRTIYGDYFKIGTLAYDEGGHFIFSGLETTPFTGKIQNDILLFDWYAYIISNLDAEGQAYQIGLFGELAVVLDDGLGFVAGIQNLTDNREYKLKNTKTYNLMGQQVNRSEAKGILIRNGKKFIQK